MSAAVPVLAEAELSRLARGVEVLEVEWEWAAKCRLCDRVSPPAASVAAALDAWTAHVLEGRCDGLSAAVRYYAGRLAGGR